MLSVAAVATGMSLSTPESNPTTGMPCSWACSSSGIAAWLSRAAKQSASGSLPSAACSISICLSTCDSLSGPSKVISTLSSAALASAPCLTACQNWCWKPLEMIGMYGLASSVAAGLPPTPASGLQAARISAVAPRVVSNRFDFIVLLSESFLAL
jgi:hypothetical protein